MQHPPEFSVTRRRANDAIVVVPVGEIDLATVDELQAQVDGAASEAQHVVLDLREVSFIDSAGLRLVVQSSRALEAGGRHASPSCADRTRSSGCSTWWVSTGA